MRNGDTVRLTELPPDEPKLPYDAEVEWLESTGTQYVDTGVVADSSLGVEMDLEVSGSISGNIHAPGAFQRVPSYTRHHLSRVSGKWRYMLGDNGGDFFLDKAVNGRFQVKVDAKAKTVSIDNSIASWSSLTPFNTRLSYWLFRRQDNDATAVEMPFAGRIYSAKLYASGVLVRDYIPVRVSSLGYLYDRANPTGGPLGNGLYGDFSDGKGGITGFPANLVGPDNPSAQ